MRAYPFLIFITTFLTVAAATNRTIDDGLGDSVTGAKINYSPSSWTDSRSCDGCGPNPDSSQAFDRTFTPMTPDSGPITGIFSFTGTAIYIYLIQYNNPGTISTYCTFDLDGSSVGQYLAKSDGTSNYQYNVLAYHNSILENGPHEFAFTAPSVDSGQNVVIFDYAVYTFESTSSDPSTTTSTAPLPSASGSTSLSSSPSSPSSLPPGSSSTSSTGSSSRSFSGSSSPSSFPGSSSAPGSTSSLSRSSSSPHLTSSPPSSTSASPSNNLTTKKKPAIARTVGGVVGGIVVIALILAALCLRRRRGRAPLMPFVDDGPEQANGVDDLDGDTPRPRPKPTTTGIAADLQPRLAQAEQQHMPEKSVPVQRHQPLEWTDGAPDIRQQIEEIRTQIRCLVEQQSSRMNSLPESPDLPPSYAGPPATDLQRQIAERQQAIDSLEQRGQVLDQTGDGADVGQQMAEIREQMQRLQEQQRSRWGSDSSEHPVTGDSNWRMSELPPPTYVADS